MVDKKVIIDGVNVSECKHYTGNVDYLSNKDWTCRAEMINTRCEDYPNCYFKQRKEKEQECETYKQTLDEISEIANADYYQDSWATLAIKIDNIKDLINGAKDIFVLHKAKDGK